VQVTSVKGGGIMQFSPTALELAVTDGTDLIVYAALHQKWFGAFVSATPQTDSARSSRLRRRIWGGALPRRGIL